jgi:5'-deoxynucleotidase YfbR-like HD superfamily hydrolase
MDPREVFQKRPLAAKPRETKRNQGLSRAWIRCPSGRRLDILNPSPIDIEIEDIALSLSRISRWAGMTRTRYGFSVAQHSVFVLQLFDWMTATDDKLRRQINASRLTETQWRLAALCHDGSEAYLGGDLCGPAKAAMDPGGYRVLEDRIQEAIHIRLGLPPKLPQALKKAIKQADRASAYAEAILIAGFTPDEAEPLFGVKTSLLPDAELAPVSPRLAKRAFLDQYRNVTAG